MVNYQQKYIKYKEKYFNLKNNNNLYGGAAKFVMLSGEKINIDYDATTTIKDVKIQIVQQLDLPYWFLINIINDDGKVVDNDTILVDILDKAVPRQWQEINTFFRINISGYDEDDTELLDMIDDSFDDHYDDIIRFNISDTLLNNKSFLLFLIDNYRDDIDEFYHKIPKEYMNDKSFILDAVKENSRILLFISDTMREDREVVLTAAKHDGRALEYVPIQFRADREVVLAAIRDHGTAIRHASTELRADRDIVLVAVRQNGWALQYVSQPLKADREVVLAALRRYAYALEFASVEMRADRDIVLLAVTNYGRGLHCASSTLKADKDVVLAAVRQDGLALQYASVEMRADRDVALVAVRQNWNALSYVSNVIKNEIRELVRN
jgi:hypothetical protein